MVLSSCQGQPFFDICLDLQRLGTPGHEGLSIQEKNGLFYPITVSKNSSSKNSQDTAFKIFSFFETNFELNRGLMPLMVNTFEDIKDLFGNKELKQRFNTLIRKALLINTTDNYIKQEQIKKLDVKMSDAEAIQIVLNPPYVLSDPIIKLACARVAVCKEFLNSSDFLQLSHEMILEFLKCETIALPNENAVLTLIEKWAYSEKERTGSNVDVTLCKRIHGIAIADFIRREHCTFSFPKRAQRQHENRTGTTTYSLLRTEALGFTDDLIMAGQNWKFAINVDPDHENKIFIGANCVNPKITFSYKLSINGTSYDYPFGEQRSLFEYERESLIPYGGTFFTKEDLDAIAKRNSGKLEISYSITLKS